MWYLSSFSNYCTLQIIIISEFKEHQWSGRSQIMSVLIGLILKAQTGHYKIKSIPALFKQADKADYMM